MEIWFKATFPNAEFSCVFIIERAHRIPAKPPQPGAPPRPSLARLFNCKDSDLVLRKARQRDLIEYEKLKKRKYFQTFPWGYKNEKMGLYIQWHNQLG